MSTRYSTIAFLALVTIASARIAATYTVFNHTADEPGHIGCGYEVQHPPLARVMTAIGPYLMGSRSTGQPERNYEGVAILYEGNHYDRSLALARLGALPFFWLASWVVYWWTLRSHGEPAAFFATLCFTFLPPVLAHAGLATTDMALTATVGLAFLAMLMWLEQPSPGRSALFGLALGASVLSKFSVLGFFPAAALASLVFYCGFERPAWSRLIDLTKSRLAPAAFAAAVAGGIVWAGYRFSFGRVPAPELWAGIREVMAHNRAGHLAYLLGEYSETGWWYYYPVVLSVKTPLAILGLTCAGLVECLRRRNEANCAYWTPLAYAFGILALAAFSRINVGVRHVLPVYIAFSIVAGVGASWLSSSGAAARSALAVLLVWMAVSSALSHPDYLPYFNEIAGDEPENILVDSDLDWGQDMKRLSTRLQVLGAREVAFDPFILVRPDAMHFPPVKRLDPQAPAPGWNAVSLSSLKLARMGLYRNDPGFQLWPARIPPTERVGKGVLLYFIEPVQHDIAIPR